MADQTKIIGNQARELVQSESIKFAGTPFGEPGHDVNTLFAVDGFIADILDTEFAPGSGGGSGRGMNELGRLLFSVGYDEDTDIVGVIGFRYALMDICPETGGTSVDYNFSY